MGQKLAGARSAELVLAKAVMKDGVLFYMFEFKNSDIHQVYQVRPPAAVGGEASARSDPPRSPAYLDSPSCPSSIAHRFLSFFFKLCVAKGKLWSVDASAPAKRWDKVENLFNNALLSFMPKL